VHVVDRAAAAATGAELPFDAPDSVRGALAATGRTEDIRFAPGGTRIAFACYTRERIGLATAAVSSGPTGSVIAVTSFDELASPALREPHGVEFLDDETLVVANRGGSLALFRLPPSGAVDPTPFTFLDAAASEVLDSPGSVAARSCADGSHELLACSNWANRLTRHVLDSDGGLVDEHVAADRWLDLPDGVAISRDGRWVAVSNHNTHCVLVFESATLNAEADPIAVLRGVRYPHGVRFDASGRRLLVADAGTPRVHVFEAAPEGWRGAAYAASTFRVMDDETFALGHRNEKEGGPKGIDIHPGGSVVAVTAECAPLVFFDLETALRSTDEPDEESRLVDYELHVLEQRERIVTMAADARAQLKAFQRTKAWRLTQPLRRGYAVARGIRSLGRRAG
jgi:hypothetical protein